jgi:hypothetical protein
MGYFNPPTGAAPQPVNRTNENLYNGSGDALVYVDKEQPDPLVRAQVSQQIHDTNVEEPTYGTPNDDPSLAQKGNTRSEKDIPAFTFEAADQEKT